MVRNRCSASLAVVLLLICGPVLAGEADPLAALPGQAVGVIGSGDQLALQVREGDGLRAITIGSEYRDGWKIQSLTPTLVTLTREGVSRQIGLNPAGAVAPRAEQGPGPEVTVLMSPEDQAILQSMLDRRAWNGQAQPGLTLDETKRYLVCGQRMTAAVIAARQTGGDPNAVMPSAECQSAIAVARRAALNERMANGSENERRSLLGQPAIGPDSFYAPGLGSIETAARAAGAPGSGGYARGPIDASGGFTMTKLTPPPPAQVVQTADGSWDAVPTPPRPTGQ